MTSVYRIAFQFRGLHHVVRYHWSARVVRVQSMRKDELDDEFHLSEEETDMGLTAVEVKEPSLSEDRKSTVSLVKKMSCGTINGF